MGKEKSEELVELYGVLKDLFRRWMDVFKTPKG